MDDTPLRRRLGLDSPSAPAQPAEPAYNGGWEPLPSEIETSNSPIHVRSVVKELLETAIFILLVFFIVRGMVQNFKIEGSSMEPTLHTQQFILVNKLVYFHFDMNAPLRLMPGKSALPQRVIYPFHQPARGEIVVFEYPRDVNKDYIKRVIGIAGDTIEVRDNDVYVNSKKLDEPFLQGTTTFCMGDLVCNGKRFVVPAGTIFVMGDNRGNSSDSREWGPLPLDRVVGQAWAIYYPISDWSLVPHFDYAAAAQP